MENWVVPIEVAVVGALSFALGALGLIVRRVWLLGKRGTFDCSVRVSSGGWSTGVARYEISELYWYAFFSYRAGPSRVWNRRELTVREVAAPSVVDRVATRPKVVIVRCVHEGQDLDFGLTPDVATGFSSWLESAPPGPRHQQF